MSTSNIGPLTTTFTPPPECVFSTYKYLKDHWNCQGDHSTPISCAWLHLGNISDSSCVPSGYTVDSSSTFYYSPGVCPTPYTTACSNVVGTGSAAQTIATCCPEAFTCQTSTHWPWFRTEACEKAYDPKSVEMITFFDTNGNLTSTTTTQVGVNAFGIEIRNGGNGSFPPSVSASPTPTQPASSSNNDGELSEGAKTGIGVGVGVGGFFILLLAALLFWRWRHPRANQGNATTTGEKQRPEFRSELPGVSGVETPTAPNELPGVWNVKAPNELEVPPAEMPTGNYTAELEGRPVAELPAAPGRTTQS